MADTESETPPETPAPPTAAEYLPTRYIAQVMRGLAAHLVEHGLGTYRELSDYAKGERGIYFDFVPPLPTTTPEESISVSAYFTETDDLAVTYTRVQIRARHVNRNPLAVRDWCDDVRATFPERATIEIGGHTFDRAGEISSTSWGEPDRPGVVETVQNIELRGNRYAA